MHSRLTTRLHATLERYFPEKRLFLRSDTETRFIRLKSETQLAAWTGSIIVVAWTIVASAILLMDSIGAGNFRAQAQRDQLTYEQRLNSMSDERDIRAAEAAAAQERFTSALEQVSLMQSQLLAVEEQRRELEKGMEAVQATLRQAIREREDARKEIAALSAPDTETEQAVQQGFEAREALAFVTGTLAETAAQRDQIAADAQFALTEADELELELRLLQERNDQIFRQLEEAMLVSVEPLDEMFRSAGLNPDRLIEQVRQGYSGQGGPWEPVQFSTRGAEPDPDTLRANGILERLDRINLYRIAVDQTPLAMPIFQNYRFTSGYGPRWGRMHRGTDFAGPIGTPIHTTADGTVTFAGWSSGYGRLIKIRHANGLETRYAHLSRIDVSVGERVKRGEQIGALGNSGRSTGPHLHYEIRRNGEALNPMNYIRAGQNVY